MDQATPRKRSTYDDIAREEGLTKRRVRQIVAQFLKEREALEGVTHADMQIDRLGRAMRVAGDAPSVQAPSDFFRRVRP